MQLDTYDHVDLTGPWAGFGFQGYRFFTPEGREVRPEEMRWWSLTCTIAREWALMMAEERERVWHPRPAEVIYLRDVIRRRREKRLSVVDGAGSAERARVIRATRGPRGPRRG
ncbi:DUF3653 domain-containing protein [Xanthomonas campestris]|uniref:DUF3653 domain-containing protein n=1 Tax=Xanthomonas campestris TaxID=339 RepID=UPI002B2230C4|nr:DUF3653 domain-containing protein [Xanthomonas campestris]MEA9922609.1 DUF3653 domain-containing protein [Xanthomonas campestris pv. raphani]MEA9947499.1 DUF3653 domain-containing protein [Xanthomonas campestris pv. raphani]